MKIQQPTISIVNGIIKYILCSTFSIYKKKLKNKVLEQSLNKSIIIPLNTLAMDPLTTSTTSTTTTTTTTTTSITSTGSPTLSLLSTLSITRSMQPPVKKQNKLNETDRSLKAVFSLVKKSKVPVSGWTDLSGSTLFDSKKASNGDTFNIIYAKALQIIWPVMKNFKNGIWSSQARMLDSNELVTFANNIENTLPLASSFQNMNGGTSPEDIIPKIRDQIAVIITDGAIPPNSIEIISKKILDSGVVGVFLVIVPHIDEYPNMYASNVEANAKDSIKLSIPQAFSSKLWGVMVYVHSKKTFEMVPELCAKHVNTTITISVDNCTNNKFSEFLSNPIPTALPGEILTMNSSDVVHSFSIEKLIPVVNLVESNYETIELLVTQLVDYGICTAIRQNASASEKEAWNNCVNSLYMKALSAKIGSEMKLPEIDPNADLLEQIKIARQNDVARKREEAKYTREVNQLCSQLFVDKTVREMTNIAMAKQKQTANNVKLGQTLALDDKLATISNVLPMGTCTICGTGDHCFKVCLIPAKLLEKMGLCTQERSVGKKGKKMVFLCLDPLKKTLEESAPRLYDMELCGGCANDCINRAGHPSDPVGCGITRLVPQNLTNGIVNYHMIVLPLVSPANIDDRCDPNRSELSLARQWLRGFVSKTMKLDVAGQDTLTACLNFLCSLATDKESAQLIFANVVSLLRGGGKNTRYEDTVRSLSQLSTKTSSAEQMNWQALCDRLIQLGEIPIQIHPKRYKLSFLNALTDQIKRLINTKNAIERGKKKLELVLSAIQSGSNAHPDMIKFGIDVPTAEQLRAEGDNVSAETRDKFLETYLQSAISVDGSQKVEATLMAVLSATAIGELATALNLDPAFFDRMLTRSNTTELELLKMIPDFVNDLIVAHDTDDETTTRLTDRINEVIAKHC